MLTEIYQSLLSRSPSVRKIISTYYYRLVAPLLDRAEFSFMSYGYTEIGVESNRLRLAESDEPHRLPIQLYHYLASAVDLAGRDVLEVSCGRGGGASYIKRYHHPRSLVGIDLTRQAIAYCQKNHRRAGLSFLQCDAEALSFAAGSFDAALNVEASHLYGRVDHFLAEVCRLLRPGGHLLLTDKRALAEVHLLRQQISDCGFQIVWERDISANVLQAIRLQRAYRVRALNLHLPRAAAWLAFHLIGADGSHLEHAMRAGRTVYLCFNLVKA